MIWLFNSAHFQYTEPLKNRNRFTHPTHEDIQYIRQSRVSE
ncbi:hypothetical Protein YC6258_02859 [Gynuella sunshinyii YC6258]|uniref:Uncharacterized protein n=1 Tax=Gynuella sunshinyii YC6258 TaxID=1445510 RepID=A0A0C5VJQ8_9GAMM|nr:hypothetical Protein YC6258_02859 [Gynuella sunshinyii YC6258]